MVAKKANAKKKPHASRRTTATSPKKPAPKKKNASSKKKPAAPPRRMRPRGAALARSAIIDVQGVELVELVIDKVKKEGGLLGARPAPVPPDVLSRLTFPDGSALSPSLRRWLAFDAGWLGWFTDAKRPLFRPKKLGQYARDEYELDWGYGELETTVGGDCLGVPGGSDSRRFLYVGKPDRTGEHPVLLTDTDDSPYLGIEYPGIDVYLAIHLGLIEHDGAYGALADDPRYASRMREHAKNCLGGKRAIDLGYGHGQFAEGGD
jgi:hypothetical protein